MESIRGTSRHGRVKLGIGVACPPKTFLDVYPGTSTPSLFHRQGRRLAFMTVRAAIREGALRRCRRHSAPRLKACWIKYDHGLSVRPAIVGGKAHSVVINPATKVVGLIVRHRDVPIRQVRTTCLIAGLIVLSFQYLAQVFSGFIDFSGIGISDSILPYLSIAQLFCGANGGGMPIADEYS